jgi:hypothetical protein
MPASLAPATPRTSAPAPPAPTTAPQSTATSVVRSYLEALEHGDRTTAASYLAHGTPSETFMDSASRIESIRSSSTGPQRYQVTADVQTSSGEYYITFTVEQGPSGLAITDHYSIKPQ